MSIFPKSDSVHIREVWNDNLEDELALIKGIVNDYPYVAMDTAYPGAFLHPVGTYGSTFGCYETIRANVNFLKLIQLGLTFADEKGNLPTCGTDKYCVWQFNFREFNLDDDAYAYPSIKLLIMSGIDFKRNREKGVDARRFREWLMSSGIVSNDSMQWVTFHGKYDFGYLLKLLSGQNLPKTQTSFSNLLKTYFPTLYDVKHLMKFSNNLYGGLEDVAQILGVERIGTSHQAGSDSLLTCFIFMKLKDQLLNSELQTCAGLVYGLTV